METRGFPFCFRHSERKVDMSRITLTDEQKLDILELIEKGVPVAQIARELHRSPKTIRKVRDEFYGGNRVAETIIAGNKYDGQLVSVSADRYSGTCRGRNGRMNKKTFRCTSSKEAIKQWEEWKQKESAPKTHVTVTRTQGQKFEPKESVPKAPITITRTNTNSQKEKSVSNNSEDIFDNDTAIFVLCVGTPNIAEVFTDESDAQKAMRLANKALEFSGVDVRYSVVPVPINKD